MAPRAVIVGATSAVGEALASSYAASGWRLTLVARDAGALGSVASDTRLRHGVPVEELLFDAAVPTTAEAAGRRCLEGGVPDVIVYVAGANADGDAACHPSEIERLAAVNFLSAATFLAPLLPALESSRSAALALIGSVAGDRGRKRNFVYGSVKAALATYAQGLRARLHPGVTVITVKLGYVDSRMSWGLAPPALTVRPAWAAHRIRRAIERRRNVVYIPGFWRLVMTVVRAIPEGIFKRLPIP
ncbi:MAG TPA: SDR family NAD(P)-dependent oxidoreductase [Anaeromyxobacteraceae bacterium]|nr:SDR family NAD(P)-dependent oxidoreductase [Anaeromyxobacteraceae bacterium]